MVLRIFNVLGREKQDFIPIDEGRVSMYVCGPTVYDHAHLGHGKTYVSFDVIVRYLRYSGYNVLYVQNLTDVGHMLDTGEDRILRQARRLQAKPMQIVETYAKSYFDDMDALGVVRWRRRPDRVRRRHVWQLQAGYGRSRAGHGRAHGHWAFRDRGGRAPSSSDRLIFRVVS